MKDYVKETEKIDKAIKEISSAIAELKEIYKDCQTSLHSMNKILDYARLLNYTDFERTITD